MESSNSISKTENQTSKDVAESGRVLSEIPEGTSKRNKFRFSFKPFGILVFVLLLTLSGVSVFVASRGILMKALSQWRVLDAGRKFGLVRTNEGKFFEALETQNLAYDLNNDGQVTGEDYRELVKQVADTTVTSDTTTDSSGTVTSGANNVELPSTRGFSTSEFDGTAGVSYPLDLPQGPAGLKPGLSFNYSSGNVDDLQVGTYVGYADNYRNASGSVGLGWNLGGMGSISMERGEKPGDKPSFVLSFEKGSANLTRESGDDTYSVWRTLPNLKIRVERYGKCIDDPTFLFTQEARCRFSWIVTDADNTKYYFGSTALVPKSQWAFAKDPDKDAPVEYWYPLYDGNDSNPSGSVMWYAHSGLNQNVVWHRARVYKWMLSKVKSNYDTVSVDAEINYTYDLEIFTQDTQVTQRAHATTYYTRASYPRSIVYGRNEIVFNKENRRDVRYEGINTSTTVVAKSGTKRINKVVIKTLNKVRNVYKLDYTYGWKPSEHVTDANDMDCSLEERATATGSEIVPDLAVHSLLTAITQYSDDPDVVSTAKKLPSNKFSYGDNCNSFCGGCPLTSFYDDAGVAQKQMSNYFFLLSAENGFGGKTTFEYWKNSSNQNALRTKICDSDKLDSDGVTCKTDVLMSTGRHRVKSATTYDGMGNSYKTDYNYTGAGATTGLAYAKRYYSDWCGDASGWNSICRSGTTINRTDSKCTYSGSVTACIPTGCIPGRIPCEPLYNPIKFDSDSMKGYEFLGYPEVETVNYNKNSTTSVASKSKNYYYQSIETASCFKPSPLKGMAYRSLQYDVSNSANYNESTNKYSVKFGSMFTAGTQVTDANLNAQCTTYDPDNTVTLVLKTDSFAKSFIANTARLCTKSSTVYTNSDGSADYYSMPHQESNYGKINCSTFSDDTSDQTVTKVMEYTNAITDGGRWMLPRPKESWITNPGTGLKYSHTRIYYDSQPLGQLGVLANPTKQEVVKDGAVVSTTSTVFDPTYSWQVVRTIDPLGRQTVTEYDTTLHLYPTKVTNALNQFVKTEYDFNTTNTALPNYGGVRGLPVKITDVNNQSTTITYDQFGRVFNTYLPGKTYTASTKPDSFVRYLYFNETNMSPCNNDNYNCVSGLGKQINNQYGSSLVVVKGSRYDDASEKVSMGYSFYDGLGQQIQSRSSWTEGSATNAGVPVEGEGLKDLLTSTSYGSYGADFTSMAYTANPYVYLGSGGGFDIRNFVSDAAIKKSQTIYDGFGRALRSINPDGTYDEVVYNVDNNPLKTKTRSKNCTDSSTETKCTEQITLKDAFGRVLETTTLDTGVNKSYVTRFEYQPALGSVTKTIDTKGNPVSIIEYDKLGRKTKMWDIDMSPSMSGDSNAWRYEYDASGNLTRQTDPKGQVTTITYDALNRITQSAINTKVALTNTYDQCVNGIGKLCSSSSYDTTSNLKIQTKSLEYDILGRAVKDTVGLDNMPNSSINPVDFVSTYTYDRGGRMLTQTLPSNTSLGISAETLTNNYNRSFMTGITSSLGVSYAKDAKYNKNGQILSYATGDNVIDSYTYDQNNLRLKTLGVTFGTSKYLDLGYDYDPLGNIIRISDNANLNLSDPASYNQAFTYDPLSRLTGATGAYTASYTYDDIGNILTKVEGGSSVNLAYGGYSSGFYHRPQTVSSSLNGSTTQNMAQQYDSLGNLTTAGEKSYQYDLANRLITANIPNSYYQSQTAGDANADGVVNSQDYTIWKTNYDRTGITNGATSGDFNFDTKVDGVDYVIWRMNTQ